jgi:hypothetical protein
MDSARFMNINAAKACHPIQGNPAVIFCINEDSQTVGPFRSSCVQKVI